MNKSNWIAPTLLILLLFAAAGGGYWAYREFGLELPFVPKEEPTPVTLPATVSMTNREGKTIDAIIVGRSATEVFLTKPEDPKNTVYTVAVANLSKKDQRFLERVPIAEYRRPKPDSTVVVSRKMALEQLEVKLARLELELKSGSSALRKPDWGATKATEISAVKLEIKKLKADILLLQKQGAK